VNEKSKNIFVIKYFVLASLAQRGEEWFFLRKRNEHKMRFSSIFKK
jgi:hypothetical protein